MLSLSEDLLFVWEPVDLIMSWHAPCLLKGERKNFNKKSIAKGQKILVLERGCIRGRFKFLQEVQGISG